MSYFNIISTGLSAIFVRAVAEVAELIVSLQRLSTFLLNEEYQFEEDRISNGTRTYFDATKDAITMDHISAKWNRHSEDVSLEDINLSVPKGNLIGIIGPVGSGKSSLLQTILGKYNGSPEMTNLLVYLLI